MEEKTCSNCEHLDYVPYTTGGPYRICEKVKKGFIGIGYEIRKTETKERVVELDLDVEIEDIEVHKDFHCKFWELKK